MSPLSDSEPWPVTNIPPAATFVLDDSMLLYNRTCDLCKTSLHVLFNLDIADI